MNVLVVGGTGMLGHKMAQALSRRFAVTCTIRAARESLGRAAEPLLGVGVLEGVDVMDIDALERLLESYRFDVVVNCIGVIKQRAEATDALPSITINSLLPHRLAVAAQRWGGRVIHFSTDCVFSGMKGDYRETDPSDAQDLYGKSKYLGEVAAANALTLRTSIIGRELANHRSLLDWFLMQPGPEVRGFTRALWSGVTTNHLADLVGDIIEHHPGLSGLYQVSSGKISKYDLLVKLGAAYARDVQIVPDNTFHCDRSLSGALLERTIGYRCPDWDAMLAQLVADPTNYPFSIPSHGST